MMPPRPSASRDGLQKRVSGAFAMLKGAPQAAAAGGADGGFEQEQHEEDDLLSQLQEITEHARALVQKLESIQSREESGGSGDSKIDDDSTGSPSMQGMP